MVCRFIISAEGIMKLYDLLCEYLDASKFSIKKRTLFNYLQVMTKHIPQDIGQTDINVLDINMLNNYMLHSGNNEACSKTVPLSVLKIVKTIINRALNYAFNRGYIKNDIRITANLKKPSISRVEGLTSSEAHKIETYIIENKRYYSYGVIISMYTGLRIGELLALKWEDIDLNNKIISVKTTKCDIAFASKTYHIEDAPKSASSLREIPITHEIVTLLKELKAYQGGNCRYVISRPNGKQIFVRAYQDSFERLLNRLKIKHYGFHFLRHTFATRCYKLGMDIKTLSELLGHSSPSVTLKIYVHTDMELKRNAINMVAKKIRQSIRINAKPRM